MNETVWKMVDIVFRDVEMTEEVRVLYEQVLSDSQERFADLTSQGLSEDEAIASVVESLRGMEEVLREYPSRPQVPEESGQEGPEAGAWRTEEGSAQGLESIECRLGDAGLQVKPSADGRWHMGTDLDSVHVRRDGASLVVEQEEETRKSFLSMLFSFSFSRGGRVELEVPSGTAIRYAFSSQAGSLEVRNLQAAGVVMKTQSGDIDGKALDCGEGTLSATTASGSVELGGGIACGQMEASSHSGDITVRAEAEAITAASGSGDVFLDVRAQRVLVTSRSGDVDVCGEVQEARAESTSGDVTVKGRGSSLTARSVSGSVEVAGDFPEMHLHSVSDDIGVRGTARAVQAETVSGDVTLSLEEAGDLERVQASSVSGDIRMGLPASRRILCRLKTRSGDTDNGVPQREGLPETEVSAASVSGDIRVR